MTKGDRIKARREELGLTQTDLAEAISSTKQNISIPFTLRTEQMPRLE